MTYYSRRDFLKLGALGLTGLAMRSITLPGVARQTLLLPEWKQEGQLGRIAIDSVSVYSEPWDKSRIIYTRYRNDLINLYYQVISDKGPSYNPRWFRVWGGYIHSAHLQLVQTKLNPVETTIPKSGMLAEITVPFTQSVQLISKDGWQPLYTLYYQSVHWVEEVIEGPDGTPWYKIIDELDTGLKYCVPGTYMRPISAEELTPIHPDVDPLSKRIQISLARQTLTAYEGDKIVLDTLVSTGLPAAKLPPGEISTKTPTGIWNVQTKMPSKHMGYGSATSDPAAYVLPGVPWCSFFVPDIGVAFHGTFWHLNYGNPMSHGCVNMKPEEAKWIFNWTTPVYVPGKKDIRGFGTQVIVG